MKLAMVSHYFATHRGGVEIVAEEVARLLVRRHGFEVTWVASATPPPPADPPSGLVYAPVPACNLVERLSGIPIPIWGWTGHRRLRQAIRACDVVVLQDTLYPGNIAAFAMARLAGKPVLIVQHLGLVPYRNPIARLAMKLGNRVFAGPMLRSADQTVFISELTRDYFARRGRYKRPDRLLFNGVDLESFAPASEGERARLRRDMGIAGGHRVFLFVGRFVEKKGLAVIRRLAQRLPQAEWILAGWGPIDPRSWALDNLRVESGLSGRALARLYQVADLLVLPSVGEGFPLVIQEAMACGTPVLCGTDTARADRSAAALIHAAEVRLEDPDGTAAVWANRIDELVPGSGASAADREEIARFAKHQWSWDRTAARYASILTALASERIPKAV